MEETVVAGGARVWLRVKGDGVPVLLLEGWGGDVRQYFGLQDKLAGLGYRVVLPELPGPGGKTAPFFMEREAWGDWIRDVEAAAIGRPLVLISHSLSATIAIEYLRRNSRCVASIFISPWLVSSKRASFLLRFFMRTVRYACPMVFPEMRWVREGKAWATAMDLISPIGEIPNVPCLVVWGGRDLVRHILPAHNRLGVSLVRGDWDHSPQIRATDELAKVIDEFVRDKRPAK